MWIRRENKNAHFADGFPLTMWGDELHKLVDRKKMAKGQDRFPHVDQ